MYGRFIDDIFAVVYAESEGEALRILSVVNYENCQIEWSCSDQTQTFLDMQIYIGPQNRIGWRPFRKARNHLERIPWISNHPNSVKRGTFLGEMSRLAVLCSDFSHYKDAIQDLVGVYIMRGYPVDLVHQWFKQNMQDRWAKRFSDSRSTDTDEQILVLKSQYNVAWDYFSAIQLGDTITNTWKNWLSGADKFDWSNDPSLSRYSGDKVPFAVPEEFWSSSSDDSELSLRFVDLRKTQVLGKSKWIVSKKRTRNLFDFTTTWKQMVIARQELHALKQVTLDTWVSSSVSKPPEATPPAQPIAGPSVFEGSLVLPMDSVDTSSTFTATVTPPSPTRPSEKRSLSVDSDSDDDIAPRRFRKKRRGSQGDLEFIHYSI